METHHLLDLFGHSIHHPALHTELEKFDINSENRSKLRRYGSLKSKTLGISLSFWFTEFYEYHIGPVKSSYAKEGKEEVVLCEMTLKDRNLIFPYGLKSGDSPAEVTKKIGFKPFSRSKNISNELTITYYTKQFEVMPVFDEKKKLIWLRIWSLKKDNRKKAELKHALKKQNKNIHTACIEELKVLKNKQPTDNWRERGTEQIAIDASKKIFNSYLNNLEKAVNRKNATSVYNAVKKVVLAFNKLHDKHGHFILTEEREEIIDYLIKALNITGFKLEEKIDITENWRNW